MIAVEASEKMAEVATQVHILVIVNSSIHAFISSCSSFDSFFFGLSYYRLLKIMGFGMVITKVEETTRGSWR